MIDQLLGLLVALIVVGSAVAGAAYYVAIRLLGDPREGERLQSAVNGAWDAAHEFMDDPHVALVVVLERLEPVVSVEPMDIYLEAIDAGGGERPDWGKGRGRRWLRAHR